MGLNINVDPQVFDDFSTKMSAIQTRVHLNIVATRQKALAIQEKIADEIVRRKRFLDEIQANYDACMAREHSDCSDLRRQLDRAKDLLENAKRAKIRVDTASAEYLHRSAQNSRNIENFVLAGKTTLQKLKNHILDYSAFTGLVSPASLALITDMDDAFDSAIENSNIWENTLSEKERAAIYDYTCEYPPHYKNINEVLRGQTSKYCDDNKNRSRLIYQALKKSKTQKPLIVYRGIDNNALSDLFVGGVYLDRGFVSASLDYNRAFKKENLLVIRLPTGVSAAEIETISAHPSEKEVLINRGQLFFVNNIREVNGRRIITVTAVQ